MEKLVIPGSWLSDPLLREKYFNCLVSIDIMRVSTQSIEMLDDAIKSGRNPASMQPWWVNDPRMVKQFDEMKKLYSIMDSVTRETMIVQMERDIGLQKV